MTNLEALTASCNYPVEQSKIQKILIDNGLSESGIYTGYSKDFDLATANLYLLLVTSANVSEGDYSVSATEKSSLLSLANGLFEKHGVANPLGEKKIINRSNYW